MSKLSEEGRRTILDPKAFVYVDYGGCICVGTGDVAAPAFGEGAAFDVDDDMVMRALRITAHLDAMAVEEASTSIVSLDALARTCEARAQNERLRLSMRQNAAATASGLRKIIESLREAGRE
jgi:hypothetical protein